MELQPLPQAKRIPLTLKLIYTAFVAVLVPVYWYCYTPVNFLFFCDVALLVTLAALWLESGYLASMMAVAITLPQLLWQVDFLSYLLFSVHFPVDLTDYMFKSNPAFLLRGHVSWTLDGVDRDYPFVADLSLFLRGLSFFHFWLPIVILLLVWRLGYDRRALLGMIVLSCLILLLSYVFTAYPYGPAGNVNKVFGPGGETDPPQTWMHPLLWLGLLTIAMPAVIYVPTHFVLRWLFPDRLANRANACRLAESAVG